MRVRYTCSWCHASAEQAPSGPTFCPACGHRADLPRLACDCRACGRQRSNARLEAERAALGEAPGPDDEMLPF